MAQILYLGNNQWITIDRSFHDGGQPAKYALIGGQSVQVSPGEAPRPTIFMAGDSFYYTDGRVVTNAKHVDYLPEPYRGQALKQINGEVKAPAPLKIVEAKPEPKKQRGRPKKSGPKVMAIKDEKSLLEAGYTDET